MDADPEHHKPLKSVYKGSRVWDVLSLLADGLTVKQIAFILHISPRTVRYHLDKGKQIFMVSTTHELIVQLVKNPILYKSK